MALICTAAPATALLTTLDRVKAELSITDTTNDDILFAMLQDASDAIAKECGRPFFGVGTYTETLKGTGSQILSVTCSPLLSIQSIYQDTDLLSPINPTNPNDPNLTDGYYIEDTDAGAIYRPGGWGQTVNLMSWGWEAYSSRYILPGGTATLRYTVNYKAGYLMPQQFGYVPYDPTIGTDPTSDSDPPWLPGAVQRAALITVKSWWFGRMRDVTVASEQTSDQKVTYAPNQVGELPAAALGLLRDYRRVVA